MSSSAAEAIVVVVVVVVVERSMGWYPFRSKAEAIGVAVFIIAKAYL